MLIGALVAGLVLGLLAGGSLNNLAAVRLRVVQVLFLGLLLRYGVEYAIESGNDPVAAFRLPLFGGAFLLLLIGLWVNRDQPGLPLAFVGILLNAVAMIVNGGAMPVWQPAIAAAGLPSTELGTAFHVLVGPGAGGALGADFLLRAIPLGDIVPIPVPGLRNVASVGDFFLAGGLAFFLFATTVRAPSEVDEAAAAVIRRRLAALGGYPEAGEPGGFEGGEALVGEPLAGEAIGLAGGEAIGLAGGEGVLAEAALEAPTIEAPFGIGAESQAVAEAEALVTAAALERPVVLGGASLTGEGALTRSATVGTGAAVPAVPAVLARVRRHPYVRLALDSAFSALWTGQLISLIGDRVHQVALAFLVLRATNSPIAVGVVFLVATLPNLLFGPIAGTLVDRWDHREVMIVSDILRAGIVLLIPIAAVTNLALVYPLVFLVTTISLFFRPAKLAILPRIVPEEDLLAANSALWVSETFADIGGFALAGLFVALLGSQLPLAFWVDSVTYVASAVLVASVAVAPLARRAGEAAGAAASAGAEFLAEMQEGWRFLRADAVLLANTLQAVVGQFMLGIFLALAPVFADRSIDRLGFESSAAYSFLEGAIGAGNLVGGFVIGLIGSRLALGKAVIAGYVVTGAAVAGLAVSGNLALAVGLAFGTGVGNLGFVIPSQTLFQRRVPMELMGRVLSLRFTLVFGSMTLAMGIGGVLGQAFGAAVVIGAFGVLTIGAGLVGLLVPAVRDA